MDCSQPNTRSPGPEDQIASTPAPVRVICFGDSLTEGYYACGCMFHPYSDRLGELLKGSCPSTSFEVTRSGMSGERVLVTMQDRLRWQLEEAKETTGVNYDWVVLLAGINDILNSRSATDVFKGLNNMYQTCKDHGARVVALTLMESTASVEAWGAKQDGQRKKVNVAIREHCSKHAGEAVLCDTELLLPYASLSSEAKQQLFDDGLHLTPVGYDRLAELVFEAMKPHLG